jgi:uncharacterized membrane protein YbhN (UPF0104 family)
MKSFAQMVFGLCLGAFLVWVLFRNTEWHAVYGSIREVKIHWLIVALVLGCSSHFARVQRWSYVIRAAYPAPFRILFSATQIGFLVNFIVPARVGELVRAYVLASLAKRPLSQSMAMVMLDRVNDIFGLLAIMFTALLAFPSNRSIEFAAGTFNNSKPLAVSSSLIHPATISMTVFLCVFTLILILLYLNQALVLRFIDRSIGQISRKFVDRLSGFFLNFAEGMHIFRSPVELTKSLFFSLLTWGAGVLSVTALMTAFRIDFPWFTPFLMLAMIAVFIIVPVTPGVIGQYHIPVVACLLMVVPGMESDRAKAFAIVAHVLSLGPIVALGIFCLFWERLSFFDLIRRGIKWRA